MKLIDCYGECALMDYVMLVGLPIMMIIVFILLIFFIFKELKE